MNVLSFDFQSDVISCGRYFRFFFLLDEYNRIALPIISRQSFKTTDPVAVLEIIIELARAINVLQKELHLELEQEDKTSG